MRRVPSRSREEVSCNPHYTRKKYVVDSDLSKNRRQYARLFDDISPDPTDLVHDPSLRCVFVNRLAPGRLTDDAA
jgi:hypothetical protein